jgi:hypothetical protein
MGRAEAGRAEEREVVVLVLAVVMLVRAVEPLGVEMVRAVCCRARALPEG